MATPFRNTRKGFRAQIDRNESRLLQELCDDVVVLLENDAHIRSQQSSAEVPAAEELFRITGIDPEEFAELTAGLKAAEKNNETAASQAAPAAETLRPAPQDPAVAALLPAGSRGDSAAEHHYRAHYEEEVRLAKIADLRSAQVHFSSLEICLDMAAAAIVLRALNHVRLTMAARLKIENAADAERVHEILDSSQAVDARSYLALIYNFLSWWQETLADAMSSTLPDDPQEQQ